MKVTGYMGDEQLDECLKGCDVVAIPAGVPRKPGGLQVKRTLFLQVHTVFLAPYLSKRVDRFCSL